MTQLARRIGVNASYLHRLESGQTSCSVRTLFAIAVELGLDNMARELRPWVRTEP